MLPKQFQVPLYWLAIVGSIASIVALGLRGLIGVLAFALLVVTYLWYRSLKRVRELEASLLTELPEHVQFLAEFLRSTYIARGEVRIVEKNRGLFIYKYQNDFCVQGTDCANRQEITGNNVSSNPVRGLAFALVGGSSVQSRELDSEYRTHESYISKPEIIIDDERFKVAYCPFKSPLSPNTSFRLSYTDSWPAAMRSEADGFFFPEAVYFPDGISELGTRLDFDTAIESISVLEVEIDSTSIRPCAVQAVAVDPLPGSVSAYTWNKTKPDPRTFYIIYYRLSPRALARWSRRI